MYRWLSYRSWEPKGEEMKIMTDRIYDACFPVSYTCSWRIKWRLLGDLVNWTKLFSYQEEKEDKLFSYG